VDSLSHLLATLKVQANVFHNGQYCGNWAVDTSGSQYISFHAISYGRCYVKQANEDTVYTLNQGDVVLFPRDSKHQITSDENFSLPSNTETSENFETLKTDGTGLVCGYFEHKHPLIGQIVDHLPSMVIVRKKQQDATPLTLLTEALLKESVHQADGSALLLERISECILALLFRDYLQVEQGLLAALANPKLAPAINAVFNSPTQKWTVEQLASECCVSRTAFSNNFKETLGVSPMEFATQWRLGLAYRALADEGATTLAAALQSGYESEASFSKAFKRVFNESPGAVRKLANSKDS
jgi:AraC-like DNA-binding protein